MKGPILIASNRGPVRFVEEEGQIVARRGPGGLVTALTGVLQDREGTWVAAAMSDVDREQAAGSPDGHMAVAVDDAKYQLRLLSFEPDTYDRAYNTVSNRLLWFLHHYLWDVPRWPRFGTQSRVSWDAYRTVNRAFAEALAEEARDATSTVLVQDYHLSLVPAHLRELAPDLRIAYFHHIPFAGPGYQRLVPNWLREELMDGLLQADLLGFQCDRWAEEFLSSARMLPGAEVDFGSRSVAWRGHTAHVGVYPITIDPEQMRQDAARTEVARIRRAVERWRGERKLIVRVDRMELSKNVLRGFLAYEDLLRRSPEWQGRVVFLAHLNPSRTALEEYRDYAEQCVATADRINEELGTADWQPIRLHMDDDFNEVLAAYALYDVLLVNPVFDGMNLVVKEGGLLNERGGTVVLSRNTGAMDELADHVIPVDPLDIMGTADAIRTALELPSDERGRRARGLREAVARRAPVDWVEGQLADLHLLRP
jgi:trehalose 6-phosphate synthase